MGLTCGILCMKYAIFIFSFILLISGLGVLGLGVWFRIEARDYDSIVGDEGLSSAANVLIGSGCAIMLIGLAGCYGAYKESRCLMAVFFLGLFLLFGLEVAGGLLAFLKKNELYGTVKENIHKAVTHMYGGEDSLSKTFTKSMDKLQQEMKCCGFNSTTNWKDSSWYRNRADKKIVTPKSCCKNQKASNCGKADSVNFEKGCIQAFNDIINGKVGINGLGGAAIGLGGSQIIGLVLTGWLYRAFGVHRGGHKMLAPGIV